MPLAYYKSTAALFCKRLCGKRAWSGKTEDPLRNLGTKTHLSNTMSCMTVSAAYENGLSLDHNRLSDLSQGEGPKREESDIMSTECLKPEGKTE